jgi:Subtilase family
LYGRRPKLINRILPRSEAPFANYDSNHGTCMASLIGGAETGVWPELPSLTLVMFDLFDDAGVSKSFGTILASLNHRPAIQRAVISLSIEVMDFGQSPEFWAKFHDNVRRVANTNKVLIVVSAGNDGLFGVGKTFPQRWGNPADPLTSSQNRYVPEILLVGGIVAKSESLTRYGTRHPDSNGGYPNMVYGPFNQVCAEYNTADTIEKAGTSGGEQKLPQESSFIIGTNISLSHSCCNDG